MLKCTPEDVFEFVTDMRNFRNLLPEIKTDKMEFRREECNLNVSGIGNIRLVIEKRTPFSDVVYNGSLLNIQDFKMALDIKGNSPEGSKVMITISAAMNPFMKLMSENYINKFLETIIDEMENFRDWGRS